MCFSETGLVLSSFRIRNIILLGNSVAQLVIFKKVYNLLYFEEF